MTTINQKTREFVANSEGFHNDCFTFDNGKSNKASFRCQSSRKTKEKGQNQQRIIVLLLKSLPNEKRGEKDD